MRFHNMPPAGYSDSELGSHTVAFYLLIGVATALALLGFASIILFCCSLPTANPIGGLESLQSHPIKPKVICCYDHQQDEKVLVIMPGDHEPTFLATQLSLSVGDKQ
ncbi:hypothetical protein SUGI_0896300 [Cryptomeria japonica]|nr:hypothetical protein SUGI_0896300 [Cryptomeria japonica]